MKKKYVVTLGAMISRGKAAARKLTHARILLKADQGSGGAGVGRHDDRRTFQLPTSRVPRQ